MKTAVVYKSVTGNTRRAAEAVREAIGEKELVSFGEPAGAANAGFGGSQEYYDTLYSRVCAVIPESCHMMGHFFCQGEIPEAGKK